MINKVLNSFKIKVCFIFSPECQLFEFITEIFMYAAFIFFIFIFFLNVWDSGVPLFHQFIVNNYNLSKQCYCYYFYRELHVTIIFSPSFCLLSVFLVRCLVDWGFCWRRLTLSVLFCLTASSRPSFPFSPFSSNALSYGAIAELSPAGILVPPFGIFLSKLLTSRRIR